MDATQLDLQRRADDLRAAGVEIVVGSVIDFAGVSRAKTVMGTPLATSVAATRSHGPRCADAKSTPRDSP